MIRENTPIEKYNHNGQDYYVKREDLSCIHPLPPLAKLRGVSLFLERKLKENTDIKYVGNIDTRKSKSGWGVKAVLKGMDREDIETHLYYPKLKIHTEHPPNVTLAQKMGAIIHGDRGSLIKIFYYMKQKEFYAQFGKKEGLFMPFGLKVKESVEGVMKEAGFVADRYFNGTLFIILGSAYMFSGVYASILERNVEPDYHLVSVGAGKNTHRIAVNENLNYIRGSKKTNYWNRLFLFNDVTYHTSEYDYDELCKIETPFPSSPTYEKKAFKIMTDMIDKGHKFREPMFFWNIGV